MRTITFFITQVGVPLPHAEAEVEEYAPWPNAEIRFERMQGDHAPGVVRPRGTVTGRTDANGQGSVALTPGRYNIVLPTGDTFRRTLSADPEPLDLSVWLAGGLEPGEPGYDTLLDWINQNPDLLGPEGPPGQDGADGPPGPQGPPGTLGAKMEPVAVSETDRTYSVSWDEGVFEAVFMFDQLIQVGGPPTPWPDLVEDTPDQIFDSSPAMYVADRPAEGFIRRLRFIPIYEETLSTGFGVDVEVDP